MSVSDCVNVRKDMFDRPAYRTVNDGVIGRVVSMARNKAMLLKLVPGDPSDFEEWISIAEFAFENRDVRNSLDDPTTHVMNEAMKSTIIDGISQVFVSDDKDVMQLCEQLETFGISDAESWLKFATSFDFAKNTDWGKWKLTESDDDDAPLKCWLDLRANNVEK